MTISYTTGDVYTRIDSNSKFFSGNNKQVKLISTDSFELRAPGGEEIIWPANLPCVKWNTSNLGQYEIKGAQVIYVDIDQ